jgi:glycosyltransferase involved in cell wall biosynthesis
MSTTDLVLASTEASLLRSFDPGRILYVPNGINTDFVLNRPSMSFDRIKAVFTGTLSYGSNEKAVRYLLELGSKLPKECNLEILIIGGPVPKELPRTRNVRFLGQLDDPSLLEIYRDANVGILPFFGIPAEGPKIKFLEYMAEQLLVVSSPEGVQGYRDFVPWKHYVPANSLREMMEAISNISRTPKFHAAIAKRGQRLAMTCYKWPDLLSQYLSFMQTLRTDVD